MTLTHPIGPGGPLGPSARPVDPVDRLRAELLERSAPARTEVFDRPRPVARTAPAPARAPEQLLPPRALNLAPRLRRMTLADPPPEVVTAYDPEQVQPPNDEELWSYFGPQRRWLQWTTACAFVLAALSLGRFAGNAWFLYPLGFVLAMNLFGMVLSALSGWNLRRSSGSEHYHRVAEWCEGRAATDFPSIDVFLPTCGEDLAVLRNTYEHVAALRWAGDVEVWVLDDGDRAEVAEAAGEFGFHYVVRGNRGHMKKAGNLQYAFGLSRNDHIAIFDADFCPRADYLYHLVPYMEDPGVGIVQTPQYFSTTTSMGWLERTAGATQELFYRWVQPSRDAVGGAICVGTCALYRREALAATGGFAQIEHSEDVHTGIFLLRAGFETRYVPIVASRGLCPDRLAGFLNQQYRWCNGSITLLRSGSAQRRPLTFRQRLCFWAGFFYYITTAINVFAIHVPGMLMATLFAGEIRNSHFIPFLAGVWVYFVLMPRFSTTRWRFEVLRVQTAYSFCHALAIFHKLTGRTQGWVATGAVGRGGGLAASIARLGLFTLGTILLVSWGAVAYDIATLGIGQMWAMMLFLIGYTYIAGPLVVEFARVLGWLPERAAQPVDRRSGALAANAITGYEVLAYTCLIVFVGVLASGYFDLMLNLG